MEITSTLCVPVMAKRPGETCLSITLYDGKKTQTLKLDLDEVGELFDAIKRVYDQAELELAEAKI